MRRATEEQQHLTMRIAQAGTIVVIAYAVVAAAQILVLNPLAAVPGTPLEEIYAQMAAAGEAMPVAMPLVVLGIGVVAAVVTAVLSIRSRLAPAHSAVLFLALLVLGAPGYFIASFGPGMSIADAFGLSGGDHSVWAMPLMLISLTAAVAAVALTVGHSPRRRLAVKG